MAPGRAAWISLWAAACLSLLAAAASLSAQGLGTAANREKQKRGARLDSEPRPAKVFTDEDLAAAKSEAASEASAGAEPGGVPAAAGDMAGPQTGKAADAERLAGDPVEREHQKRARLQAEWRIRFANAREQLANAETASWHEVVRTGFQAGIPVPMKIKEQVETPELKRARQQLRDLEEEFRRTGLPAGWARESP